MPAAPRMVREWPGMLGSACAAAHPAVNARQAGSLRVAVAAQQLPQQRLRSGFAAASAASSWAGSGDTPTAVGLCKGWELGWLNTLLCLELVLPSVTLRV